MDLCFQRLTSSSKLTEGQRTFPNNITLLPKDLTPSLRILQACYQRLRKKKIPCNNTPPDPQSVLPNPMPNPGFQDVPCLPHLNLICPPAYYELS